jgi:hypothetical protein
MTTKAITPLRKRMIEDMNARKLCVGTQRGHIRSCKRFAALPRYRPVLPDHSRQRPSAHRSAAPDRPAAARADSGHTAAPPSSVMNARRLIQ